MKVVYEEKYKKTFVNEDSLPVLNHITTGFEVVSAELLSAGRFENGNEFQVIRVEMKEAK